MDISPKELSKLRQVVEKIRLGKKRKLDLFYDPVRDGVTFSVLSAWNDCREKSRLGLHGVTSRASGSGLVFGGVTHGALQTVYGDLRDERLRGVPSTAYVQRVLSATEETWRRENPRASRDTLEFLEFSMLMSEAVLPQYFRYWEDDFTHINWLHIEREFRIPVAVPVTYQREPFKTFIRGKMDGNFRLKKDKSLWLFETKTKSHIDEETIADILPHELQVNIYLWAMKRLHKEQPAGVRYNLIRRPQLRQRKVETTAQFALRCAKDVSTRPDWYFMRQDMEVDNQDMTRFEGQFMDLVADFLAWWYGHAGHYKDSNHCENKYGKCAFLPICGRRDYATFYKRAQVFRELEEI